MVKEIKTDRVIVYSLSKQSVIYTGKVEDALNYIDDSVVMLTLNNVMLIEVN